VNSPPRSLSGFYKNIVEPGTLVVTDDWKVDIGLKECGYKHHAAIEVDGISVDEECQPSASTGLLD
jgi:hypothetical protein